MNSAARFLGLATACTTLLIAGTLVEPASAQGEACKENTVTASGRAKFRPFTKTKELEGRGSAMADAVVNWQKEVREKYGDQWDSWSRAKGTNFECAPTKSGKIIGSSFIGCTISGRPCASGGSSRDQVVVERERDKGRDRDRDSGRDRDRDRDRDWDRDKDRRYGGWEVRAEERRYERAMAFQDYLAKRRRRAETRAYERVMAFQERLANRRKRIARLEQAYLDDKLYRRHGSYGRHGYGRYGYGRYESYRRYASYSRYRAYTRYRPYGHYCNCAPYREYSFVPRFYSYSFLPSYYCAEP